MGRVQAQGPQTCQILLVPDSKQTSMLQAMISNVLPIYFRDGLPMSQVILHLFLRFELIFWSWTLWQKHEGQVPARAQHINLEQAGEWNSEAKWGRSAGMAPE